MGASYVLVSAAAVIVVEAIAIAFTIPSLLANQDLTSRVRNTAYAYVDAVTAASTSDTQLVLPSNFVLGQQGSSLGPGKLKAQAGGVEIPQITGTYPDSGAPVALGGKALGSIKNLNAYVYVQAPVQAQTIGSFAAAEPLLLPGLVVLLLAVPVGTLFGLLTTRGVVRRLRRLAGTSASYADGDFALRVAPGPPDEVGKLERNFNEMAGRLQEAVRRERLLAEKSARLAERSRISRELHDSISQDLFSLSLLAGGLEKALPADSPVRGRVETLAETVQSTNREMRALLLELRPSTLDEKGLVAALEELASNYATRLGIKVDADLEPVTMAPAAEG